MGSLRELRNVVLIALGCALVLAAVRFVTADRIRDNESARFREQLVALLPPGQTRLLRELPSRQGVRSEEAALPAELLELGRGTGSFRLCDGTLLASSEAAGYGGSLVLLYSIAQDGHRLVRLTLLRHQETPGITDFLNDAAGWLASLEGRDAASLQRLSAVSGATITSRALTNHLQRVLTDPEAVLGAPATLVCAS